MSDGTEVHAGGWYDIRFTPAAMSFSDYIEKYKSSPNELPLVHTTEYLRLSSIQSTHTLEPRDCAIFKEPLLYFFYGRPAYRDHTAVTPTREIDLYPICFVFKPGTVCQRAKRLYPFDTGASQRGLYEPAIPGTNALTGYQVRAVVDSAKRIVNCFFQSNEAYLYNEAAPGLVFVTTEGDAESYYRLINGGGDPQCDDRCSAVELQIDSNVDLRHELLAVVLPRPFLDDGAVVDAVINEWHAIPLTYSADRGMRPLEFHHDVREAVRRLYRQLGLI